MTVVAARRVAGSYRVLLYDKGCKYRMAYPGHARKYTAARMQKVEGIRGSTFDASALTLADPQTEHPLSEQPSIEYVELPGSTGYWSVQHYQDASQVVGLANYVVSDGTWEEIDDPDYTGKIIYQRDATVTSGSCVTSYIESTFTLPANPMIDIDLWRGDAPKDHDRTAEPLFTRIYFGNNTDSEYCLVIPYGGQSAYVEYKAPTDGKWYPLQAVGDNGLPSVEGIAKGQRLWIRIRVVAGKLHVSFNNNGSSSAASGVLYNLPSKEWKFVGVSAYYPDGWTWVDRQLCIKPGTIAIEHNAGQVAFRWWPLYCPTGSQYIWYVGETETLYTCWDTAAPGVGGGSLPAACQLLPANCDVYVYSVWDYNPLNSGNGWRIISAAPTVTPFNPSSPPVATYTCYSWYASIEAVEWHLGDAASTGNSYYPSTTGGGTITHCQSPQVYGVQVRAEPYVGQFSSDWPDATDISGYVQSIVVDYSEGNDVGMATVRLEQTSGGITMYENQLMTIELGYEWSDGTDDKSLVFAGYIATPGGKGQPGPQLSTTIVAFDPAIRLRGEKGDDTLPDFQTFAPADAVAWCLKRAGYHSSQYTLSGATTPMYMGRVAPDGTQASGELNPDSDEMMPGFGVELLEAVSEYCRRDNESEWWVIPDATVKFKFVKNNGAMGATDGALYEVKEDGARTVSYSTPSQVLADVVEYRCYNIDDDTAQMDPGSYADCVILKSQTPDGEAIHHTETDWARIVDTADSAWSGGWRHMYCEVRRSVDSIGLATQRAAEILAEKSRLPKSVTASCDLIPAIVRGDRYHITEVAGTGLAERRGVRSTVLAPKHLRVMGYRHTWDGSGKFPQTVLQGRSIWV